MRHTAVMGLLLSAFVLGADGAWAASYSYDDTVAFAWETAGTDVVWEGVDTSYPTDDDKQLVGIGFSFNFGGVDYTQVRVLSNGALHFGADQGFHKDYTNEALPITSDVNGPGFEEPADRVIAPYWADLNPSSGGTVRYSTLGSAPDRRFVASWEGVPRYPGTGSYTAQVILYENGDIKFQYGGGSTSGSNATIGVEVDDSDYTQYSYNSGTVSSGKAILFTQLRHFAISHDGNGDLCTAENITITRHYGSHVADTGSYTGTISVSTSTGNGTWSLVTGGGTLTNLGGGSATYAFAAADAGQVVLGLLDTVAETVNINVSDGSISEDPSEDPDLVFSNTATETFRDEFNAVSYAGNDGTRNWSGNWVEFNDNGNPNGGDERVMSDLGNYRLRVQDNNGGGEGVYREADLSGFDPAATATLSFDYRRSDLDNSNDYVAIQVSANGGGSWTELARIQGPTNDSSYHSASYDITSYMAANTQIRFISSPTLGNNDKVYFDNVQIAVSATTACAGTDHFAISHDGMGINCVLEPVAVSAKLVDGSTDVTYTGTITLDTQTGTGTWSLLSGNGSFTDAVAGDGLATYQYAIADNGVASFNLDYQSGAASIDVDAYEGAIRDDDTEGALVFSPNGFVVTASALSNPPPASIDLSIPAQTAASNFTLYLAAYGQTPSDPVCGVIESYDGAKNLKFWSGYNDPATGTLAVNVNGAGVAGSEGSAAAQGVTFSSGQASVTVNYADVGDIGLSLKDDTVGDPDLPTGIRGASQPFVVRPAGFVLSDIKRSSDAFANPPGAVDENSTVFIAAGSPFSATVTAVNALGNATPNYGQEAAPETVLLTPAIVAAGGVDNPAIGYTTGFGSFSNGAATGTDFYWPEVGIITLTPSVGDADYLGAGDVTGTTTGNVGRFIPYDFDVALTTAPAFNTQCGSFTYLGQPFDYNVAPGVTITARAATGTTTQNYDNAWWKLADFAEAYAHNGAISSGASLDAGGAGHDAINCSNCAGSVSINFTGNMRYTAGAPETDPFTGSVDISFSLSDSDGVTYAGNPFTISAIGFDSGADQRSGRGYARDAYGTYANLGDTLILPVGTEYYDAGAGGWLASVADSCTSYSYTQADNDITTSIAPAGSVALSAGSGDLAVTLTGDPGDPGGSTTVTFTWDSWLTGTASATATFGIFRGDDRFLYWQEAP